MFYPLLAMVHCQRESLLFEPVSLARTVATLKLQALVRRAGPGPWSHPSLNHFGNLKSLGQKVPLCASALSQEQP